MSDITVTVRLPYQIAVQIAEQVTREMISTDASMRSQGLIDPADRYDVTLQNFLDYVAGEGEASRNAHDRDAYERGYEAGALAGDASEAGLVGYQLGRKEGRERAAYIAERMADEHPDPHWTLACLALAERLRTKP